MAKPQLKGKQAMPGPYDPPAKSPVKPSQSRKPSSNNNNNSSPNRFYDGPTVSQKANEVKDRAQKAAAVSTTRAEQRSKKALATVKRHPWSLISLLTTIPFLITISLFSTVVCPPPGEDLSPFSKFVLSPLGLHDHSGQHSQLHQAFCYPSNVYHKEFLQPYVYPIVDDLQDRASRHPLYVKALEPTYRIGNLHGQRIYNKSVRPVVLKAQKGIRKIYLTFIEPHIPYIKSKIASWTAPYTSRISALHRTHLAPHIDTAGKYAQQAGKKSAETYNYVTAHPYTGHAGRYANKGFQFSKAKGQQAYKYTKPHAIRAGKEAERIAREILGPRAIKALQYSAVKAEQGWAVVKLHVQRLYYKHLDPYVGPHLATARTTVSPYTSAFHKKVYLPYVLPLLEQILPPAVLAPAPPKSIWAILSDILPGSHVAERKVDMDRFHEKVDKARKPANVPIPGAEKVAKAESAQDKSRQAKKFDREEMNRVRDAIKERVDKQGKKGYETVRTELLKLHTSILSDDDKFPALKKNANSEIERDFEYILKGLDKLYTASTTLTREQVDKSASMGDARAAKKVKQVQDRADKVKGQWHEQGSPIVREAFDDLERALGTEYKDLQDKMAWMDDVTPKDWTHYNALREDVEAWSNKYIALHNGETKDRALNAPSANINRAISSFNSHLTDMLEAWRDQVRQQKKLAYARIEAREALAAESPQKPVMKVNSATKSVQSAAAEGKATSLPIVDAGAGAAAAAAGIMGKGKDQVMEALSQASSAAKGEATNAGEDVAVQANSATKSVQSATEEGKATILPIVEAGAGAAAAAAGIIGKGRDQVLEALSQASSAALGEVTQAEPGVVEQAKSIIDSVYDAASSNIHDATRSVISAVGATPSPESPREHVESAVHSVSVRAEEMMASAMSALHQATQSIRSAASAAPSAGSVQDRVGAIVNDAAEKAQAAYDAAGSVVHDATRSVASAVGATPSPESAEEYLEAIANNAKAGYAAVAGNVASNVHDATRAGLRAVGATPSPEGVTEHVESVASEVSASISSVASVASASASSLASVAGESIHEGTRAAQRAVGVTPSPESPSEYAAAAAAVVSASVESAASAASSAVHDATKQVKKGLGIEVEPENAQEYASSVAAAASKAASSIYTEATASAASAYESATSIVGGAGSAATLQAALIAAQIREALVGVSTPEPIASTASAYLAQLSSAAVNDIPNALSSGQSILASLRDQAGSNIHQATRAASRAVGATPTPETPGEYVEDVKEKVKSVVQEVQEQVEEQAEKVVEGAKRVLGRDEL